MGGVEKAAEMAIRRAIGPFAEYLALRAEGLRTVAVFGSHARGEARPESDLDLLVVADFPVDRAARRDLFGAWRDRGAPAEWRRRIASVLLTPEEARRVKPFYLGMLEGIVLLLDRDRFFAGILDDLRRRLEVRGARRLVSRRGDVYWDLCPNYPHDAPAIL